MNNFKKNLKLQAISLEGAGGKLTSIEGNELDYSKPFKGIIASNSIVHDQVVNYCS